MKAVRINDNELENVIGGCIGCVLGLSDHCTGQEGSSFGSLLKSIGRMLARKRR